MTGNDIIDLAVASATSNWKRKGFLEKIFTQQEQYLIAEAPDAQQMVWRLWSMKESAYKLYIRQFGGRFFAPKKFICEINNELMGRVVTDRHIFQTTSSISLDYIYSIAANTQEDLSTVINSCVSTRQIAANTVQQFVYDKLITAFAEATGKEKESLLVIKDKNSIPFLFCEKEGVKIPVSITHHGSYAAFTIQ